MKEVSSPAAGPTPIRYLIVDDYPLFVTLLTEVMTVAGNFQELGVAHTGRDGLAAIRTLRPDLVILDLLLPDLSGLELIRLIRAEQPAMKIIVSSAMTNDETIEVAFALGADAYFEKSMGIAELLAVLKAAAQDRFPMNEHVSQVLRNAIRFRQTHNGPRPVDYRVLLGLATGQSVRDVAHDLGLSASAVYKARHRLAARFPIRGRRELGQLASRLGMQAPAPVATPVSAGPPDGRTR